MRADLVTSQVWTPIVVKRATHASAMRKLPVCVTQKMDASVKMATCSVRQLDFKNGLCFVVRCRVHHRSPSAAPVPSSQRPSPCNKSSLVRSGECNCHEVSHYHTSRVHPLISWLHQVSQIKHSPYLTETLSTPLHLPQFLRHSAISSLHIRSLKELKARSNH